LASGVVVGSAAGVVPALFTFGLSIPAGAVAGGTAGLALGATTGGGFGGISACGAYKYRVEIKNQLVFVRIKCLKTIGSAKSTALMIKDSASRSVSNAANISKAKAIVLKNRTLEMGDLARTKAGEMGNYATTTRTGVTATSLVAGGVVGGVAGGSTGTVVGAVVGIVPALFTFGLSIPVSAGIGLCCGTVAGSTAGAVGGGALGFGGFTYRKEISGTADKAWTKVSTTTGQVSTKISETASQVRTKAIDSATQVKDKVTCLVGGGTGGSDA